MLSPFAAFHAPAALRWPEICSANVAALVLVPDQLKKLLKLETEEEKDQHME